MKTLVLLLFPVLTLALMLGIASGNAVAQNVGDNSIFFTTYYSNNTTGAPDATVRVINDGDQGAPQPTGDLWAAFYIFDDSQELTECCACLVSPDGLTSESVSKQLTATPLTGLHKKAGVIKLISSASSDPTAPAPKPGLRAWATHIQKATGSTYAVTETLFADSNLGSAEQTLLGQLCYFADYLLSGQQCTCTPEDADF
jgi:hypothetical protein